MASVDFGAGRYPVAIAAGRWHTCALLDNDDVKVGGDTRLASLPPVIHLLGLHAMCVCARVNAKRCRVPTARYAGGKYILKTTGLKHKAEGKLGSGPSSRAISCVCNFSRPRL